MLASTVQTYVGITGIQDPLQVKQLVSVADELGFGASHRHTLMLGCLASAGTETNSPPVNTHRPDRHVDGLNNLIDILLQCAEHRALGMVHFELTKLWPASTGHATPVISLLKTLAKRGLYPPVQLNGVLLPDDIIRIRRETGVPIVFQMRKEISNLGEQGVLRYLEDVASHIDTILFDPSAGTGESFTSDSVLPLVSSIKTRFTNSFRFGFAGGLGATTTQQAERTSLAIRDLRLHLRPDIFSVDVETNVRIPGNTPGTDMLCIDLCTRYLHAVRKGFTWGESC